MPVCFQDLLARHLAGPQYFQHLCLCSPCPTVRFSPGVAPVVVEMSAFPALCMPGPFPASPSCPARPPSRLRLLSIGGTGSFFLLSLYSTLKCFFYCAHISLVLLWLLQRLFLLQLRYLLLQVFDHFFEGYQFARIAPKTNRQRSFRCFPKLFWTDAITRLSASCLVNLPFLNSLLSTSRSESTILFHRSGSKRSAFPGASSLRLFELVLIIDLVPSCLAYKVIGLRFGKLVHGAFCPVCLCIFNQVKFSSVDFRQDFFH